MKSIEILSRNDMKEMIKEEFEKLEKQMWAELNKNRNRILDLEELVKYFKRE